MGFYNDFISGLNNLIGKDKPYKNPKQLADALDVAPVQVSRYLSGERGAYLMKLGEMLDTLGARLVFPGKSGGGELEDFVLVPKVLARPAGGGSSLETAGTVKNTYAFRSDWLSGKGSAASMRLMDVTGDSMAPRIEDGDTILIDESQARPLYDGKIYVVRVDDEILVKRVAKMPGRILLMSDNPQADVKRIEIDLNDESVSWEPVGRVVYVSKDLK